MLKFIFKWITVNTVYGALLSMRGVLAFGEFSQYMNETAQTSGQPVTFTDARQFVLDKLIPQQPRYSPLPRVSDRPWWDILGQHFPSLGKAFTEYDNSAIDLLNNEVTRRYEVESFPRFSFIFDFRMYPVIIGTIFIAMLALSLVFPSLRDKAKKLIPVFFSTFFIKYVSALALVAFTGDFTYYLTFSNIWFGDAALHFYVFLADILLALVLFLYLRSVHYYINDSAGKIIERYVTIYFKVFYALARYLFFVTMIYIFSGWLSGNIIAPVVSALVSFLGRYVSITVASFVFDSVNAFYWLFDFIQPCVNLVITGTHYRIVPDLIGLVVSMIQYIEYIPIISFVFSGVGGLFSSISTWGWIGSLASLGTTLIINWGYSIFRSFLFSFFSEKLRAVTVKVAKSIIYIIRFRNYPNNQMIRKRRESDDVKRDRKDREEDKNKV